MFISNSSTFVVSSALKVSRHVHLQTYTCEVNRDHRPNIFTRWRCSVTDSTGQKEASNGGGEDDKVLSVDSNSTEILADSQEGPLLSNSLDQNFEDALAKDWDRLMDFDHENFSAKPKVGTAEEVNDPEDVTVANISANEDSGTAPGEGETTATAVSTKDSAVDKKSKEKKQTRKAKTSKTGKNRPQTRVKSKKNVKSSEGNVNQAGVDIDDGNETDANLEKWSREPHWYFVQVKPGCEKHVAQSVRNLAISLGNDEILDVFVPMTTVVRLSKGGISTKKDERYFPGYTLVLMVINEETYGHILRVPHVQCFMGDANRKKEKGEPFRPPIPLSDEEMKSVFDKLRTEKDGPIERKMVFSPGDPVRVVSGSMEGSTGKVVAVAPNLNIVKCNLMVFGSETKVELNIKQVEAFDGVLDEDEKLLEAEREVENRQDRTSRARGRVDSLLDLAGENHATAGMASAADDLAALLSTDSSDDWDPLQGEPSYRKQRKTRRLDEPAVAHSKTGDGDGGFSENMEENNDVFTSVNTEDDGFTSVNMEDDGFTSVTVEDNELEKDGGYNQGLTSEALDNDGFTSSSTSPLKSSKKNSWGVKDDDDVEELNLSKKPGFGRTKSEQAVWSEEDLDKFLDGGDADDLWNARDDPLEQREDGKGSKGKSEENADLNQELLFSDNLTKEEIGKNVSGILKEIDTEMRDEDLVSDENDVDDTDDDEFDIDDEIFDFEHQLPDDEVPNVDESEAQLEQTSDAQNTAAESRWNQQKMNLRQRSEENMDNNYMMMYPTVNPEDIDDLEPVIRIEGEENFKKVDFMDSPPSLGVDYDEIIAKERAEKTRRETSSDQQKKSSTGRQSIGKKTGKPRGRPRKTNFKRLD